MTNEQDNVLRILDANINRSEEAMRTIEEYIRFVLNDRFLTETVKQMRHDLQALAEQLPWVERVLARDSSKDVGRTVAIDSEYERHDISHVVAAALGRLKQSLRALEEYSKVLAAELGEGFERLRYQTYDLEKVFVSQEVANDLFESLTIYGLVPGGERQADFESYVISLLKAGIDVIQLRDKNLDDKTLLDRATRLRELIDEEIERTGRLVLMIINDRPDIARISRADGVHLGQTEIPISAARELLGDQFIIGVSTHCAEQVEQAVIDGADYIGCGPTFPSSTKSFEEFPGTQFLDWVSKHCTLPAFAIGGVNPDNVQQVANTGFTRVAISGCLHSADDQGQVIQSLRDALRGSPATFSD
ncbi:MAG: thiamine phosphate synthase [Planctomycetaceae bacterium]